MTMEIIPVHNFQLADVLRLAAAEKVLDFELGTLDLSISKTRALLVDMAALRRERYFGITFRCNISVPLTPEQAVLLASAGVVSIRVLSPCTENSSVTEAPRLLAQLEAVKLLHEVGVVTHWDISWSENVFNPILFEQFIAVMTAAGNLPPPTMICVESYGGDRSSIVEQFETVLDTWRSRFRPLALTYARGPDFVRVRDRRQGDNHWTFITLKAQQSDVFLFCRQVRTLAEIGAIVRAIPGERLAAFLDNMVDRQLMCHIGPFYLSLPTRRTIEERWCSDVY